MYFVEIVNIVIVSVKTIYFYVYTVDIQFIQYKKATTLTNKCLISCCSPIIFYWVNFTHQKPISKQDTRGHSLPQGIAIIGLYHKIINISLMLKKQALFRITKHHYIIND